jgi:hypothetical protein
MRAVDAERRNCRISLSAPERGMLQHGSHCVVDAAGLAREWKRMVAARRGSQSCSKLSKC